jgi:hypothetical protein
LVIPSRNSFVRKKLFLDKGVTENTGEKHKICKSNRPPIDKLIEDKASRLSEKYGVFETNLYGLANG